MPTPTHNPEKSEKTISPATGAALQPQPVPTPAISRPPTRAPQGSTTVRDLQGAPRAAFRSYREEVEAAKRSFSDTAYVMNSRVLIGGAGAANRGVPKVVTTKTGGSVIVQPSPEDYKELYDLRRPAVVLGGLKKAMEDGKFRTWGQNSHLIQAIGLPAVFGFSEAASSLAPNRIADYSRTSVARNYKALNAASPVPSLGDGRLLIQPIVFDGLDGRREIFGFKNPTTNEVAVATQFGNMVELTRKISFGAGANRKVIRTVPEDGVLARFPYEVPSTDGPAMVDAMAAKGYQPITDAPPTRADLPPIAREKGADTLAAEGLLRAAKGVLNGAMDRVLDPSLRSGNKDLSELDSTMAGAWDMLAQGLMIGGVSQPATEKAMNFIAPAMKALAVAETAFTEGISRNGAHRDTTFAVKSFLVEHYGITKDTSTVSGVPVDKLREILADRTSGDQARDSFGAAATQATVGRALKLDQIHEALVTLLPDLMIKDGAGNPLRATEMDSVKDASGKITQVAVPAFWSDPGGKSGRPRFRTELDGIISSEIKGNESFIQASKGLDRAVQQGKLNMAILMLQEAEVKNPTVLIPADRARFRDLALAVARREPLSDGNRADFSRMMTLIRTKVPALAELERIYLDGPLAASVQIKINDKEMERNGFAAGRIIEGRDPSPLSNYPVGTYSMPPSPSAWVAVLPDNQEMTRFTAFQNGRELDGDILGSEKAVSIAADMDLNSALRLMRECSIKSARVTYTAIPRSEFVAPRDERGFPLLMPGLTPARVTTEQEQIAHARRLPIFRAPDNHDSGRPHLFSLEGVTVDVMSGRARSLFAPGTYIPMFILSPDGKESLSRLPDSFGSLNQATDEVSFITKHPNRADILSQAKTVLPAEAHDDAAAAIDSLFARRGRYSYPGQTFRAGAEAYRAQREKAVNLMEAYELASARREASFGARTDPESAAAILAAEEARIRFEAKEAREGANFVHGLAIRDADRYEGRKVSGLVTLVGDGTGERSHNWLLAWESVADMMNGPDSLTAMQSKGILAGRIVKSRLD